MWHQLMRWLAAVSLALTMALPAAVATGAPPSDRLYLALGNSLAVGIGATDPATLGYVPHLFHFLHGADHGGTDLLTNLAVSGETSGSFITHGQLATAIATIGQDTDVQVVTLDIGGNDLLLNLLLNPGSPCAADPNSLACRQAVAATLASFAESYAVILSQLRPALAADPGAEHLLVLTVYNPLSGTGHPGEAAIDAALLGSDGRIDCSALGGPDPRIGLNDLISCIGRQFGATVADVYPAFAGKGSVLTHIGDLPPDIHPTNAGHAVIAATLMRTLTADA